MKKILKIWTTQVQIEDVVQALVNRRMVVMSTMKDKF